MFWDDAWAVGGVAVVEGVLEHGSFLTGEVDCVHFALHCFELE